MWSELPPDLLQLIAEKLANYVDYIRARPVCKPWLAAIAKRPHKSLCRLPFLLLPYQEHSQEVRGLYNIPDNTTYGIKLPEAYEKRCCGSSNGWLIMVEESPSIFLLNPLTRARIDLPSLSSFPTFPTDVIFENSQNLNESFITREKLHVHDTFIVKAILSDDPSLSVDFTVVVIYGFNENIAFARYGDVAWTCIDETSRPFRAKDIMFHGEKLHLVNQLGRVSICEMRENPPVLVHVADPPPIPPKMGYKQWYLASLNNHLLLVGRYRKVVPDYEYQTQRFEVYRLEQIGGNWSKTDSLDDKALFLGCNSSLSVSASKHINVRGNCTYFTDDYMRICTYYVWEGHDFGVFSFDDGSVRSLCLPSYQIKQTFSINVFFYEQSLQRDTPIFVSPPPVWITTSP